jgi:hypothetical protein
VASQGDTPEPVVPQVLEGLAAACVRVDERHINSVVAYIVSDLTVDLTGMRR